MTIMFEDYNVHAASPEFSSRRAWAEASSKYKVNYSDEGPYNWGGRKFIIHSYNTFEGAKNLPKPSSITGGDERH